MRSDVIRVFMLITAYYKLVDFTLDITLEWHLESTVITF